MSDIKMINKHPTSEQHEKNLATIERYRLVSDNDGHEYAIPVYLSEDFDKWIGDDFYGVENIDKFDQYRVDGRLTFTDPQVL